MKLLFDQNISFRLVSLLADIFPASSHVRALKLTTADDEIIWEFAAAGGFAIVSKDSDFKDRSFLYGQPPKVIWVCLGNCSVNEVEKLLRENQLQITEFLADPNSALLALA